VLTLEDIERRLQEGSRRCAAAVTALHGALAIATPITNATAATTPDTLPGLDMSTLASLPAVASLWDVSGLPLAFDPSVAGATVAKAHTVVDSTYTGATVVQVLNGAPTNSSIVGSP
jgi:hypothetical protein